MTELFTTPRAGSGL